MMLWVLRHLRQPPGCQRGVPEVMDPHALHETRLARALIRGFLQGILVHLMPTDPATARVRGQAPAGADR